MRLAVFLLALLSLCHCATQTGMGRARVLEPGQLEWGGAPVVVVHGLQLTSAAPAQIPWLELMLQARLGLLADWEVGARSWLFGLLSLDTVGAAFDVKYQLRRGDLDVATGGSLQYQRTSLGGWPWHGTGATVPLHLGYNLGRHQLLASVRAGVAALLGESQKTQVYGWGGIGVGFALTLGRWQLVPEAFLGWAPVGWNGAHADRERTGASAFELALGVLRR